MIASPSTRRRRAIRAGVQLLGFAIGLGLLAWAASLALSEGNREQLQRLGDASWLTLAALGGLTLATLAINGGVFWLVLRPVRRLSFVDVQAVNALATFLNYLPFKLSLISRIVIHNRRDGLPVLMIGGWFAAVAATMLAAIAPLVLVTLYEPVIGVRWLCLSLAGVLAVAGAAYILARAFAGERGLARLHAIADPLRLRPLQWFFRTRAFGDMHHGLSMLANGPALSGAIVLRLVDLGVQAVRFMVAAAIVGHVLSPTDALLLAMAHFVIGVASPAGALGFRESGSAGLAAILAIAASEVFALVALVITAVEAVVLLAAAGGGVLWLRPGNIFSRRVREDRAES